MSDLTFPDSAFYPKSDACITLNEQFNGDLVFCVAGPEFLNIQIE
jgi:hypothetical protein